MSVAFRELGGSPVEEYTASGFQARREFLIAWNDRDAFAEEILGRAIDYGASPSLHYPGTSAVFATSVRFEPFAPANPDAKPLASLDDGLNSYSQSFAKATVTYQTRTLQDRADGPASDPDTQVTYRMQRDVELLTLLPRGWQWADNPSLAVPEDLQLLKTVPVTDHFLTWHQVVRPPWGTIRALQGMVNLGTFLGCPEATMLFRGATANKRFRSGFPARAAECCWEIEYAFRERAVKFDGRQYGWNHVFRDDPPGWAEPTHGSDRLYELADFSRLFRQSETA